MVDIWRQVIAVDDENDPDSENIPDYMPQKMNSFNCKPEVIFSLRQSKIVHQT